MHQKSNFKKLMRMNTLKVMLDALLQCF